MIYVTGDLHGSIDIQKLLDNNVTRKITKDDYVIVCGDFGLIWNYKKEDRKERKWLKYLNERPWTTLFCDGNHECFPRLNSFPVKEWNGGKVHEIRPKVLHLMRGEIFNIEGKSIFVMGGASSHDRGPAVGDTQAVIGKSWWPEEMPSDEELEHGRENLRKHGNKVDYIITHCLPSIYQEIIKKGEFADDKLTDYFREIDLSVEYEHWYSGHYHFSIDVNSRMTVLFSRIVPIGNIVKNSEVIMGLPKYHKGETVLIRHASEPDSEPQMGMVTDVHPWGPFGKHDEPYYEIALFGEYWGQKAILVKESEVVEKSLAE